MKIPDKAFECNGKILKGLVLEGNGCVGVDKEWPIDGQVLVATAPTPDTKGKYGWNVRVNKEELLSLAMLFIKTAQEM